MSLPEKIHVKINKVIIMKELKESNLFLNKTKKTVKRNLFHPFIWLINWSIWSYNFLNKGYDEDYKNICSNKDVTPFLRATGFICFITALINLGYLMIRLIFYKITRNRIQEVTQEKPENHKRNMAKWLYQNTSIKLNVINNLFHIHLLVFYVVLVSFSSNIIYIYHNKICDVNFWDYFIPACVIVFAIVLFGMDLFSLIYECRFYNNKKNKVLPKPSKNLV